MTSLNGSVNAASLSSAKLAKSLNKITSVAVIIAVVAVLVSIAEIAIPYVVSTPNHEVSREQNEKGDSNEIADIRRMIERQSAKRDTEKLTETEVLQLRSMLSRSPEQD